MTAGLTDRVETWRQRGEETGFGGHPLQVVLDLDASRFLKLSHLLTSKIEGFHQSLNGRRCEGTVDEIAKALELNPHALGSIDDSIDLFLASRAKLLEVLNQDGDITLERGDSLWLRNLPSFKSREDIANFFREPIDALQPEGAPLASKSLKTALPEDIA